MIDQFEYFYANRMYGRVSDCWNRPISSMPGAWIQVRERKRAYGSKYSVHNHWRQSGNEISALNLSSYNYLGFAVNKGPITESVIESVAQYGTSTGSTMVEGGFTETHRELEETIAKFVGKESAIIFGMGYATNSTTIPGLIGKGSLVISDTNNHASLVSGCRSSGASIAVFKHNDMSDLRRVLRSSIVKGQPKTGRPWKKIMIIAEGIYSMEGDTCPLPELVKIKKEFGVFLYVDEAHSIGAMGNAGRGICDYWNVDPADVDILMGTFTKSFGSVGGYVASSKSLIDRLRQRSFASVYAASMPTPCAQQALSALNTILGLDGTDDGERRLRTLKDNSNYFRNLLIAKGFRVFGARDSPVIPMMLYMPGKIPAFSRLLLERNIAVVIVGFPATPLTLGRVRFCISASHNHEDLKWAAEQVSAIGNVLFCKYHKDDIEGRTRALKAAESIFNTSESLE